MGGRGTAAFGSHSASVLTKATAVLVTLFFVLAIGLAIVKTIVQRNRGDISVSSEIGKGTVFTVVFPAFDTEEEQE